MEQALIEELTCIQAHAYAQAHMRTLRDDQPPLIEELGVAEGDGEVSVAAVLM